MKGLKVDTNHDTGSKKNQNLFIFPEAYLESSQTSTVDLFAKVVNAILPLTFFAKKLHRRCSTEL